MRKLMVVILSLSIIFFVAFSLFLRFGVDKKDFQLEQPLLGCECQDYSGLLDFSQMTAYFEGKEVKIPYLAFDTTKDNVLGVASEEKWIEVDLSEQKLKAWEGDRLFLESSVSTGLPWWPTPKGEFRIWIKLRATRMEGGSGRYYYNLPNVPYVMYFENSEVPGWRGYGLHGTYWHNDFGIPRSHGCINLPTEMARELYYWTGPVIPAEKSMVRATQDNLGTRVVIHD